MKYQEKMNRYEKKQLQEKILDEALAGEGLYLYENNSDADLTLPRPTQSGRREIGGREQFQGDDYYMQLVRTGFLRLIKELQPPTPAAPPQTNIQEQNEVTMTEQKQEKLILDQPDTVTTEGTVENVAQPQQCNKGTECCGGTGHGQSQPEVLLNEAPVDDDDSFMIIED